MPQDCADNHYVSNQGRTGGRPPIIHAQGFMTATLSAGSHGILCHLADVRCGAILVSANAPRSLPWMLRTAVRDRD